MSEDKNTGSMENFIKSLQPVIKSTLSLEKSLNSPEINNFFPSIGETAIKINTSMEPYIQTIAIVQKNVQRIAESIDDRYSDIKPFLYALSEKIGEVENNTVDFKDLDRLKEIADNFSTQQIQYNINEYLDSDSIDYEHDIDFQKHISSGEEDKPYYYPRPISKTPLNEQNDSPFYKDKEWYQKEVASFILQAVLTGLRMLALKIISEIEFIDLLNKLINFISNLKN